MRYEDHAISQVESFQNSLSLLSSPRSPFSSKAFRHRQGIFSTHGSRRRELLDNDRSLRKLQKAKYIQKMLENDKNTNKLKSEIADVLKENGESCMSMSHATFEEIEKILGKRENIAEVE